MRRGGTHYYVWSPLPTATLPTPLFLSVAPSLPHPPPPLPRLAGKFRYRQGRERGHDPTTSLARRSATRARAARPADWALALRGVRPSAAPWGVGETSGEGPKGVGGTDVLGDPKGPPRAGLPGPGAARVVAREVAAAAVASSASSYQVDSFDEAQD